MEWLTIIFFGIILVIFILYMARKSWRTAARKEYIKYIKMNNPNIEIVLETEMMLKIKLGSKEIDHNLYNFYNVLARVKDKSPKGKQDIYDQTYNVLLDVLLKDDHFFKNSQDNVLPRILSESTLSQIANYETICYKKLDAIGLVVVYVIDSPNSVIYVTTQILEDINLKEEDLYGIALANLDKNFPQEVVRMTLEKNKMNIISFSDTYDAARLLLLPKYIPEGSQLIAQIPDRDMLILIPYKEDFNNTKPETIGKTNENPILSASLLVSRAGFKIA